MSKISVIPLEQLQEMMGEEIKRWKGSPDHLHITMSITEHLKDAARWQYVKTHDIGHGMTPDELQHYVDLEIKK